MTSCYLEDLFYVEESDIHGKGLYAKTRIEKGTFMGTYEGPEIVCDDDNGSHVLWTETDEGKWIGRDGKNLLRYLNHSVSPHAEFHGFELYAIRDIHPETEITIDYGEDPE